MSGTVNSNDLVIQGRPKVISVVIFLILAAFSNWATLSYIHDFVGREPLPDIIFGIIDEQPWAVIVGNSMVLLCSMSLVSLFIFHKYRLVIFRRILCILAVLYTIRTIMMLSTQMPSSYTDNYKRCRSQLSPSQRTLSVYLRRTLEQVSRIGFQESETDMLCGDLIFSGHSLVMVVSMLSVDYYIPKRLEWLRYFTKIFAFVGMFAMVLSRTHYTCDVIIAYIVSLAVFTIYHAFCEIERPDRKNSIMKLFFLTKIFSWLEENVQNDQIENEFEIPSLGRLIECWQDPGKRKRTNNNQSSISSPYGTVNVA